MVAFPKPRHNVWANQPYGLYCGYGEGYFSLTVGGTEILVATQGPEGAVMYLPVRRGDDGAFLYGEMRQGEGRLELI
eukprot:10531796-Ditylum_brightwellii.AAC.1